jgi:subtilisin family serine protease
MSFNLNYDQQAFMNPLMEKLIQADKILVAAAGDNSILKQYASYPAYLDTTLSVGAINSSFELSGDEIIAENIDFLLPNEDLLSCGMASNLYVKKHGSSMATALISGIIALMLQNEPNLRLLELKQRLSDLSVPYQNNTNRPLLQLIKPK